MGASESKLAFKEDIFKLSGQPDIPADSAWWSRFYQLPESADDVFALWSPNDLRHLTTNNNHDSAPNTPRNEPPGPQKNAETLIYVVIARLEVLQTRNVHPDSNEVLNCVRILTRLLPYIYEADHLAAWEAKFFWKARKATWVWDKKYNRRGPLFDGLNPSKKLAEGSEDQEIDRPLGERLIDLLINYLFLPGFALPKKVDANGNPDLHISYSIWQSGIGCKQSQGTTKENERNAMEVLRLLLTLSSRMMYLPSNMVAQIDIKALTYITTQCSRQAVLSLICSLLNTVLKYNPASWRVPLDLTAVTKDPKQLLVTYSLQLLLILIIYPAPSDQTNAFRKSLSRLHRVEDFQFIQQGLTLVLTQPVSGVASYVPTVSKALPWAPEMLVLFWELLQCNKRFRSFIIDTDRAHDLIVLVLYYAMDAKDDPARQGTVRMCVFILQTLSVESTFGRRLNKPFVGQDSLPSVIRIPNFHGTYADYLITSIHAILTTTKGRLESIYPALLAIINNIAPYVQELQRATCTKLLDLFISFSSPGFLLANDGNHTLLLSLLEAMCAILDHQYDANRRFVDILCRSHKRFEALRDFTVDGALTELDRINQERKDRNGNIAGITSPTRGASMDSIRSPASSRSPSLGNVPEHGAFAIGDDDDDEEDLETPINNPHSRSQSNASASMEDAVPTQSRSMSEKARGKQPVGHGSFSRSASRNTSNTSLASLQTQTPHPLTTSTQFTPTGEWLESWLPHLPLHTILQAIEDGKSGTPRPSRQPATPGSPATSPSSDLPAPPIRLQTFTWSSLALGWYMSMLWGFIFAQDAQNNRGSNGLWAGTSIKLFNIANRQGEISLRSPKGAVDAVGDSLARRIGSFGFGGTGNAGGGGGTAAGSGGREN